MYNQNQIIHIEAISDTHLASRFNCGHSMTDHYWRHVALEHDNNQIARTYVARDDENTVLGFYSLSTASVEFEQHTEQASKRLPRYPVTAAMITHLAVDSHNQQHDIAEKLLIDALRRIMSLQNSVALTAIVVTAHDNMALALYLRFGFIKFPGHSDKLFLPLATISKALGKP